MNPYFRTSLMIFIAGIFVRWFLNPPVEEFFPFLDFAPRVVNGSRVVVTGASLGIGKAIAKELALMGAKEIVIASRSVGKLNEVKRQIMEKGFKGEIYTVAVDLSNEESSKQLIEKSVELMGGIDYLILNHITTSRFGTWLDDNKNSHEGHSFVPEMFSVNTFSYMWTATAAMEELQKSNGAIAVVSSLGGHVASPKTAAYSASKHALHGFFDALRIELRLSNINNVSITLCAIGATDTEGAADIKKQISVTWDPPEYAARAIIRGMVHRQRDIYHPHHLVFPLKIIDALAPQLADYILFSTFRN